MSIELHAVQSDREHKASFEKGDVLALYPFFYHFLDPACKASTPKEASNLKKRDYIVLSTVVREHCATQREVAAKTGYALGLVNASLKYV